MEDVKSELESLKQIYNSYGHIQEYDMFLRFESLMIDLRFFRLVKEYRGSNPEILKRQALIKS